MLTITRGLIKPQPGQQEADPGVIIMGYEGDPLRSERPAWARDGSVMVFRKLEQDVKGWNDHLKKNTKFWDKFTSAPDKPKDLTEDEKIAFLGAAFVGRWKSVGYSHSFHD